MRALADRSRLESFINALAKHTVNDTTLYLTGGATAVFYGWRGTTVDVDIKLVPEDDAILRAIPGIKDDLSINVELAAPDQFIPVREGWQERSPYITQVGHLVVRHFELCAQALAKIERGHEQDRLDVAAMLRLHLVTPSDIQAYYNAIESTLYRYPAIDPQAFHDAVMSTVHGSK